MTAANNYFVVSSETLAKYQLEALGEPIIQKGQFVNGSVSFESGDFERLVQSGRPCYLLNFHGKVLSKLPSLQGCYVRLGRRKLIHKRYKTLLRERWLDIPSIWKSEGFFFKRSHHYPKLIKNEANVLVTDSAYRIKMHAPYNIDALIFSFYNSLSLAFSELNGRFYGGGVLELTPNEFKKLPIPYMKITSSDFQEFKSIFLKKKSIDSVLQANDTIILKDQYGFTSDEVSRIQKIRNILLDRRLRRR